MYNGLFKLIRPTMAVLILLLATVAASIPFALFNEPDFSITGQNAEHLIIENAHLLDNNDKMVHLLIKNSMINIISEAPIPALPNETRINAKGMFLSPGLIDTHVHIYDRTDLLLNLAYGITTVRNMHGMPHHLRYRSEIASGHLPGPKLIVSSPIMNKKSGYAHGAHQWFPKDSDQARQWVRQFKQQGYDLIKVYDGLDSTLFKAIVDEAKRVGLPFAGHPPFDIAFHKFLESKPQTLEHSEMLFQAPLNYSYEHQALSGLIAQLVEAQIPIDPTLYNFHELVLIAQHKQSYLDTLSLKYLNPNIKSLVGGSVEWALSINDPTPWLKKSNYMAKITLALHQAGVPLVLGSDAGAGFTINGEGALREIKHLNAIGIPLRQVLEIATVNSARALDLSDKVGKIALGFEADLLLTKEPPTQNIDTLYDIQGLFNNGVYYNQSAIRSMKLQATDHMSAYELMGWYLIDQYYRLFGEYVF